MIYEEKSPNKILAVLILIAVFVILYSPWNLSIRELLSEEGKFAAIALEMNFLNPSTVAHGETLANTYPLFPYIAAIFYKMGLPLETGVRLTSVLALAGMVITIFVTCFRIAGIQSAVVGSAFMMSTMLMLGKAIDGNPFTLGITLILLGWLLWYYCAAIKGSWNKAWIYGSIFCGLAFYTIGWAALFYFFLPLIFSRRPLTIWKRLNTAGFKIGMVIIAAFVGLWMIHRFDSVNPMSITTDDFSAFFTSNYLKDFIIYPFQLAFRLLPWTFIAWPAFCVAYHPLDKNPIFSRFLRTLFLSVFFVLWFSPDKDAKLSLLLVAPLAIMAGMHYWLAVRRNGYTIHLLISIVIYLFTIYSAVSFFLFMLPQTIWAKTDFFKILQAGVFQNGISFFFSSHSIMGMAQTLLALLIGLATIIFRKKISVWLHSLCAGLIFMLCFWAITIPYRSQDNQAKLIASQIKNDIGDDYSPNLTIYKGAEIADMYVLGAYIGCHIKKIHSYDQIPTSIKTAYVLTLNPPIYPERQWTKVSSPVYNDTNIYVWEGVESPKKTGLEL
ncbi:MAG: hypothetical protein WCR55_09635 [Lentisphaerota bacterium]